ncbi:ninjurin-2-like [Haliotis rubra]|uniref:ninjurin-2-like n=1 Tax=Haliotis rubra TaxID=36100 RepID=UPI001EE59292|nr:ninjurin-2-like [Haliotis rubra]
MATVGAQDMQGNQKIGDVPPGYTKRAYATRKTVAEGLLDFALLMANATQLKALLDLPEGDARNSFFYTTLSLLGVSIALQIITGILIFVLGTMEVKTEEEQKKANSLNNASVALIMFITVVNVFITAFGIKYTTPV